METVTDRKTALGGSDAAAALGMSRWQTPLALWAEKTGQIVPEDISDKLHVRLGNRLEQVVAELFTEETGKKVARVNEMLVHPKYPFLVGHIDRRVVGEDAILECKTASGWKMREWLEEEIPPEYQLQVMHYLAITGKQRAYIACLIGGNQKLVIKTIERDEAALASLVAKEVHFWNTYVVPKVMPGVIKWDDGDTLCQLFPQGDEGEAIQLDDDANRLIESLKAMNQDYSALEKQIEQTKNEIKAKLGDHTYGKTPQWVVSWKNQPSTKLDVERMKKDIPEIHKQYSVTKQIRVLRTKENKEAA